MEKETETIDMFFRTKEELKKSAEMLNEQGDLWYSPIGHPFRIDPAGKWRKVPLGEHWQPICLNAPEWILAEFTECYSDLNNLKDTSEILKGFAYYLFRNRLQNYVRLERFYRQGKPVAICYKGQGVTEDEAIARMLLDKKMMEADGELQAVLKKLQSVSPESEECKQLMAEYMRLHGIQSKLARLAGDRVNLASEFKEKWNKHINEANGTEPNINPDSTQGQSVSGR